MPRRALRRYFRHGMLTQLMVFEAVARLGSVTRAAEELHLAQPTVSTQLGKLAEALDVQLFEQRGRQLHLTPAGRELLATCGQLMRVLEEGDSRLERLRAADGLPEVLRLAAEPEAREIAARLLAGFSSRHPGVQVSLFVAERAALLARFGAGEDDVYLFELEIDGVPEERRWSLAHPKGRGISGAASKFMRDALRLDALADAANNAARTEEGEWKSRGNTTRQ